MFSPKLPLAGFVSLLAILMCASPVAVPTDANAQGFFGRNQKASLQASAEQSARDAARRGVVVEQTHGPNEALRQSRLMTDTLSKLKPERRGIVDAYVVSIGLDSDGVFGREAVEAGRVLSRRFDAIGQTVVLANGSGANDSTIPDAHPNHLGVALAQIGEMMNKDEDVLVLYMTTHGHWATGLSYRDGERATGNIAPARLAAILNETGIKNRLIIVSACYSGVFIPAIQNETTITMTAASSEKPSFGCRAENDWTFFGDALINNGMRQPTSSIAAFATARNLINKWESAERLDPSNPQIDVGIGAQAWLSKLDARVPETASTKVGRAANAPIRR